jgi:hypothetical protein
MGQFRDAITRRRWSGGGLVLLALLGVLVAVPLLKHRHGLEHPLAASERIDLCPFLARPPAPFAGATHAPQRDEQHAATCEFTAPDGKVGLRASLSSTRQLSASVPVRTDLYFDTWKTESAASAGTPLRDLPGPWNKAFAYRDGDRNLVVAEDHGVFLVFESRLLDAAALEAWAAASTAAVRESPKDHHGLD